MRRIFENFFHAPCEWQYSQKTLDRIVFACLDGLVELEGGSANGEQHRRFTPRASGNGGAPSVTADRDEFLDYILMDKQKKLLGSKRIYEWYGKKFPHVAAPLEYHGEPWDFAFADPGGYVRLFKQEDGDYYGIETNWRDPRAAGSIASQKRALLLDWIKLGREDERLRFLSDPRFDTQSFEECRTDAELLTKLSSGHWPTGKGFHIDDICFINVDASDGRWLLLKKRKRVTEVPWQAFVRDQGIEMIQSFVKALRARSDADIDRLSHGR